MHSRKWDTGWQLIIWYQAQQAFSKMILSFNCQPPLHCQGIINDIKTNEVAPCVEYEKIQIYNRYKQLDFAQRAMSLLTGITSGGVCFARRSVGSCHSSHGPPIKCVKLQVAHVPGMTGTFFPCRRFQRKPLVSDPGMHHCTCVTHMPWCMSESLTRGDGENVPGMAICWMFWVRWLQLPCVLNGKQFNSAAFTGAPK